MPLDAFTPAERWGWLPRFVTFNSPINVEVLIRTLPEQKNESQRALVHLLYVWYKQNRCRLVFLLTSDVPAGPRSIIYETIRILSCPRTRSDKLSWNNINLHSVTAEHLKSTSWSHLVRDSQEQADLEQETAPKLTWADHVVFQVQGKVTPAPYRICYGSKYSRTRAGQHLCTCTLLIWDLKHIKRTLMQKCLKSSDAKSPFAYEAYVEAETPKRRVLLPVEDLTDRLVW